MWRRLKHYGNTAIAETDNFDRYSDKIDSDVYSGVKVRVYLFIYLFFFTFITKELFKP